jgi:Xaa-Pro aminopeptidase
MGVDYEQRVDFARLREYRVERAKAALEASECGAFLLFDFYTRGQDPILWDFGSAVKHHKLYSQWVPTENYRWSPTSTQAISPAVSV